MRRETGIDKRTLSKWLTTILVAQRYTPLIQPSRRHSIDIREDPRFASSPLSSKLLELFYGSYPNGRIEMSEINNPITEGFCEMGLLKAIEVRGNSHMTFTEKGLKLALELRDLVNGFYESLLDVNWANAVEVENKAEEWEKRLGRFESRLLDMVRRSESVRSKISYIPPLEAAEMLARGISDNLTWLMGPNA
jgi:hypothetical protein